MKKQLSDFELFERTKTPNGMMMRVPGGWELNGAYISSEKFGHIEVEVYDKTEEDVYRKLELRHILFTISSMKYSSMGEAKWQESVKFKAIEKVFLEYGVKL